MALRKGRRGLDAGSSLPRLLAKDRNVRNEKPALSRLQMLEWADAHYRRTGAWPRHNSGVIVDAPGETWGGINTALNRGRRGLQGRSSLARLLAEQRGKRYHLELPPLSCAQILEWADAFHDRTGKWPHNN